MKLLIATGLYPPDIGGPATYSKLLADELPKRGWPVKVLSFGTVRHLPKGLRHFIYFCRVLKLGRRVDLIFAQDPVSVGLPAILAAKILGKKFILRLGGDYAWEQHINKIFNFQFFRQRRTRRRRAIFKQKFDSIEDFQKKKYGLMTELRRQIQKGVAKRTAVVIVPSEYLRKIVSHWGVSRRKIKVIYSSLSQPEIGVSKEVARQRLNLSGTALISAGRLVPWKGFETLIEVFSEVLKQIPDAKLIIIGSGPQEIELKSKIKELKLERRIFLLGQLSQAELQLFLRAADIFVLNTGYEGLSHLILEAMQQETPVVTTEIGGNPELINDGFNGLLVEYNNKSQLKEAIFKISQNKSLRKKITQNAKKSLARFSSKKIIRQTLKVLEQVSR